MNNFVSNLETQLFMVVQCRLFDGAFDLVQR